MRDKKGRFVKGSIPWNKGLTKETDVRVLKSVSKRKETWDKIKGRHLKPPNCRCKQCGKEFRRRPYAIKIGRGIFCSKRCQGKWFSENIRGDAHPFYGKHHTKESNEKNRQKHLGRNNPNYGKPRPLETREKIKRSNLEAYCKAETWRNWLRGTARRPTKPEKRLCDIIDKYEFPFEYVGNGKLNIGRRCPDFIRRNGDKKIVEVFGDYWHRDEGPREGEKERIEGFKEYGYECLVIWEHELVDAEKVARKIEEFLYA